MPEMRHLRLDNGLLVMLAISYLDRFDLAHVDPTELHHDSLGDSDKEQKLRRDDGDALASIASSGFVRGKLRLLQGGGDVADKPTAAASSHPIHHRPGSDGQTVGAALAVSDSPETAVLDERLAQARLARLKGYVGDPCPGCANFTLVRSGTCLKCDTCGSTTGCS